MRYKTTFAALLLLLLKFASATAQTGPGDLRVFGYFQAALGHQQDATIDRKLKSFTLQQLNLFLQKDVGQNWSAFINFEVANSYSSQRNWGAFSLEEAWVNYNRSKQFKLKLGLLTPAFNHLNEIKNRTPLLPYIIRPVVYESSFSEVVDTDEFAPQRAFVQAYGFIPMRATKWDYAIYVGNSPSINTDPRRGVTGIDTTRTFLFGGRLGVRHGFFKAGFSATHDKFDARVLRDSLQMRFPQFSFPVDQFQNVAQKRIGADLSYMAEKWFFEAEYIHVAYDFGAAQADFDKRFFYATLGYHLSERVLAYVSYWDAHENLLPVREQGFQVPTLGFTYEASEMVVFKVQSANAHFDGVNPEIDKTYNYTYCAVSVRF